jgi:copper chaperone CopZ
MGGNYMKVIYKFDGIDCAACANELEGKLKKVDKVNDCVINFMTGKINLDIDSESVLPTVQNVCEKFEGGVKIKRMR